MRRGKVIGLSVCLSVVTTKIARSRNLGLRKTRKRNQSAKDWLECASNCFGTVHGYHKKHLFLAHHCRAH